MSPFRLRPASKNKAWPSDIALRIEAKRARRAVCLCHILLGVAVSATSTAEAESNSRSAATENGIYTVTIQPSDSEIPIAKRHAWKISIQDRTGGAIQPTQLAFYGGMPAHGHGLPSAPRVTRELAPGIYLVEGVLFNMHGNWEIVVGVVGPAGADKAIFKTISTL